VSDVIDSAGEKLSSNKSKEEDKSENE